MGGVDKGQVLFLGTPLVLHAARRLRPQVGAVIVSANRSRALYEAQGLGVVGDASDVTGGAVPAYAGPLAGMLAGLRASRSPWLAVVACDAPRFPLDLVERLVLAAVDSGADAAVAITATPDGSARVEPTFCLLRRHLADPLAEALARGENKAGRWLDEVAAARVPFADDAAFLNANTSDELARLEAHG